MTAQYFFVPTHYIVDVITVNPFVVMAYQEAMQHWNNAYPATPSDLKAVSSLAEMNTCGCGQCVACVGSQTVRLQMIMEWYVKIGPQNNLDLKVEGNFSDLNHVLELMCAMERILELHYRPSLGVAAKAKGHQEIAAALNLLLPRAPAAPDICYSAVLRIVVYALETIRPDPVEAEQVDVFLSTVATGIAAEQPDVLWLQRFTAHRMLTLITVSTRMLGHMLYYTVPLNAIQLGYVAVVGKVLDLVSAITEFVFVTFPAAAEQAQLNLDFAKYKRHTSRLSSQIFGLLKLLRLYMDLYKGIARYGAPVGWPCPHICQFRNKLIALANTLKTINHTFNLQHEAFELKETALRLCPRPDLQAVRLDFETRILVAGQAVLATGTYSMSDAIKRFPANAVRGMTQFAISKYLRHIS